MTIEKGLNEINELLNSEFDKFDKDAVENIEKKLEHVGKKIRGIEAKFNNKDEDEESSGEDESDTNDNFIDELEEMEQELEKMIQSNSSIIKIVNFYNTFKKKINKLQIKNTKTGEYSLQVQNF